jgi:hypothetical protein
MFVKKVKKMVEVEVEEYDLKKISTYMWEMFERIIANKEISGGAAAITKLEDDETISIHLYFCDEELKVIKIKAEVFKMDSITAYTFAIAYIAGEMASVLSKMEYN